MPIIIPKTLPAHDILKKEKIFVMDEHRAGTQDIRPIEIAILNLMPTKVETETQLVRLLSNSPLQIKITFINTATYTPTHVSSDHMQKFYKNIDEVRKNKYDGMIITGAPVETLPFEDVYYWQELKDIFNFADKHVTSTIYICWGAQAALYHHFGIGKVPLEKKLFGIFPTEASVQNDMLLKGMDDVFYIPHSRHTRVDEDAIRATKELKILAESKEAGISIVKTHDNKKFFLTGHSEYDRDTLKTEYLRDVNKGLDIEPPKNYFVEGTKRVNMCWKSTANLLFYNWLNYYVYQVTPYVLEKAED
jgi:homoserine O-succinyltransferase